jgi:hypothetical protein
MRNPAIVLSVIVVCSLGPTTRRIERERRETKGIETSKISQTLLPLSQECNYCWVVEGGRHLKEIGKVGVEVN